MLRLEEFWQVSGDFTSRFSLTTTQHRQAHFSIPFAAKSTRPRDAQTREFERSNHLGAYYDVLAGAYRQGGLANKTRKLFAQLRELRFVGIKVLQRSRINWRRTCGPKVDHGYAIFRCTRRRRNYVTRVDVLP